MKNRGLLFFLMALLTACTNQSKNDFVKFRDTISILNCVLSEQSFQAEVTPQTQTLVFIKSRYDQHNWPQHLGAFNIVYEHEQKKPGIAVCYKIEDLELNGNTGKVIILCISQRLNLTYNLVKKGDSWAVKGAR